MAGIDENQPGDLLRVGGRVEADDDAAKGMADQHIGSRNASAVNEGVEVGHGVCRGARHRHGVAAAGVVSIKRGPRTIIGADARERGDAGEDRHLAPASDSSAIVSQTSALSPVTSLEQNRRAPVAAALQPEPATTTDVDEAGEVTAGRGRAMAPPGWRTGPGP